MKKRLLLLLFLCGLSVVAQKTPKDTVLAFQEITIVGDRALSISGAGAYLNSQALEKRNQPNINHVLREIPGVNVRDEEGFGLRPNIGLRGTSVNRSAKITLMEDGVLMAPAPYADPSAYYFPTFARMQGVEVLKGSSQIKYGPYTIGGAVNLLSTAIPESFKGFAQLSYGSFGTNQERVWIGDSHKNIDYVFEVHRLASDGFKELDNGGSTGFDRRDVLAKLHWHTQEVAKVPQSLTLKFFNATEDGDEAYLGLTYEDFKANPLRRYAATQKDVLAMNHQHLILSHNILPFKRWSLHTTAYTTHTFRDWARVNSAGGQSLNNILATPTAYQTAYQIMTGQANGNLDHQSAARTYYAKGGQSVLTYKVSNAKLLSSLQLGFRYHEDEADRYATRSVYAMTNGTMVLTSAGVKGNQENQIRHARSFSTYLAYELFYKGWKLTPGIRYEKMKFNFQNYGNADTERLGSALKLASNELDVFLPGMGITYNFNPKMNAFVGIHKGFSPPGMPSTTNTAQALPETALNYEIGYRYYNRFANVQVVGFVNQYDNILGSDNLSGGGAGSGDVFNAGRAKIQGLELSLGYDLLQQRNKLSTLKLPFKLSYTFTDAKFLETFQNAGGDWGTGIINANDLIPFITPHLLSSSIGIENDRFNTTLSGRYVGETRTKPGQASLLTPAENVAYNDVTGIAAFWTFDVSANYKVGKQYTLFSTINNLTDSKSIITNLPQGYRPGMPFSFNFGIKANI